MEAKTRRRKKYDIEKIGDHACSGCMQTPSISIQPLFPGLDLHLKFSVFNVKWGGSLGRFVSFVDLGRSDEAVSKVKMKICNTR